MRNHGSFAFTNQRTHLDRFGERSFPCHPEEGYEKEEENEGMQKGRVE